MSEGGVNTPPLKKNQSGGGVNLRAPLANNQGTLESIAVQRVPWLLSDRLSIQLLLYGSSGLEGTLVIVRAV